MPTDISSFIITLLGVVAIILALTLATDSDRLRRAIELATLAVLTITLGFVAHEAAQLTKGVEAYSQNLDIQNQNLNLQLLGTLAKLTMEQDKVLVSYPSVLKYFFDSEKITNNDENYDRARATALLILDYIDSAMTIVDKSDELKGSLLEKEAWDRFFKHFFQSSPLSCTILLENDQIFGTAIVALGRKECAGRP